MASPPKPAKDEDKNKSQNDPEKGKGCMEQARHAIAKTLVSTNPNLLTEAQTMGCGGQNMNTDAPHIVRKLFKYIAQAS